MTQRPLYGPPRLLFNVTRLLETRSPRFFRGLLHAPLSLSLSLKTGHVDIESLIILEGPTLYNLLSQVRGSSTATHVRARAYDSSFFIVPKLGTPVPSAISFSDCPRSRERSRSEFGSKAERDPRWNDRGERRYPIA